MKTVLWFLSKFDRKSLIALIIMCFVYWDMLLGWHRFFIHNPTEIIRDGLSVFIWVYMTFLLCWNIDVRRDLARIFVGFFGGLVIESWGTFSEVWSYYTNERPPLWILPAWPVAAIAIDRMARGVDKLMPATECERIWWFVLPPYVVYMTYFVYLHGNHLATLFVLAAMLLFVIWPGNKRQDVTLMIGGSMLGAVIEYFGTSRMVWTYYTGEVPPVAAVIAHGFASVAFQRGAAFVDKWMPSWQEIRHFRRPEAKVVPYTPGHQD